MYHLENVKHLVFWHYAVIAAPNLQCLLNLSGCGKYGIDIQRHMLHKQVNHYPTELRPGRERGVGTQSDVTVSGSVLIKTY